MLVARADARPEGRARYPTEKYHAGWLGLFAIAPNDSLITARDIGTEEIYALDLELP